MESLQFLFFLSIHEKKTAYFMPSGSEPGKGAAIGSLVLGILGVVFWFFGYSSILSVIFGIIGIVLAGSAKKSGYVGGMQTAGFVLSILSLIGGLLVFIACTACVGGLALLSL